ncbi:MAG: methyltransferase domain-containing protein [Thermoplasmata archaeon]
MVPKSHELTTTVWVELPAGEAFPLVLTELRDGLAQLGITVDFRPGGLVMDGAAEIGSVTDWKAGERVGLEWRPAPWKEGVTVGIRLRFDPVAGGTSISWEIRGLERLLDDPGAELVGWVTQSVLAPSLKPLAPTAFGDWFTDRKARKPSGRQARETYGDPSFHWPNFLLILDRIDLQATDRLLEVGCGGGAFLRRALESGCTAVGIDHSPEMVRESREANRETVAEGRAVILEAEADQLPDLNSEFSCAVMTGVFGFLPHPVAALKEIYRALRPNGRIAVFAGTDALRGTPACPEPIASRMHFYDDQQLSAIAEEAGFVDVRVEQPSMDGYAQKAGLPEDVVAFFRGIGGAQLLLARKPG